MHLVSLTIASIFIFRALFINSVEDKYLYTKLLRYREGQSDQRSHESLPTKHFSIIEMLNAFFHVQPAVFKICHSSLVIIRKT